MTRALLLALTTMLTTPGCAAASPTFRDAPPVWKVDDARDIPEPTEREFDAKDYFAKIFVTERLDRTLSLRDEQLAANINSLEEVPDSTWFQNRIGRRRVLPAEAARAASTGGPPCPPFKIIGGKLGGGNPGFLMTDATGRRFLVKFDTLQNPELQTSAGVIVNRIMWTAGYNVPSDHVFVMHRQDLTISAGARYTDERKHKKPLDWSYVERVLATSPTRDDGGYRAFSSQLLEGIPKGGFQRQGVRDDDPNDRVAHEHRRELRGLKVLASWLGHTDMKEDNTLDMYVSEGERRYLKHYLLDFGEALDGHAAEKNRKEDGWEHLVDWEMQTKATFSFGLWKRPWEDTKPTPWPALGSFSAHPFDPLAWREAYPYWPFAEMDASDAYWAAKLVMRFGRPILQAIVAEGKLRDQAASAYLLDTLLARRDAIGRAYLDAVSPLDDFTLTSRRLCMTDLATFYGFAQGGSVEWLSGSEVRSSVAIGAQGRVCVSLRDEDGGRYTVYRMRVRRGVTVRPPLELHFKAAGRPRILGLIRVAR
jgi:hypothetical protein